MQLHNIIGNNSFAVSFMDQIIFIPTIKGCKACGNTRGRPRCSIVGIYTPDIDLATPLPLHHFMISPREGHQVHLGSMLSEHTVTIALRISEVNQLSNCFKWLKKRLKQDWGVPERFSENFEVGIHCWLLILYV